ncbi:MAG: alpha/beta hydrolase [Ruminococcaceae bacterium]|nr:alpha/beta hydrolase [Oscillospiraceae bacterium]
MKKRLLLFAIILAVVLPVTPFVFSFFRGYDIHTEMCYGEAPQNTMDIYMPKGIEGETRGVVLFIHGGSWMGGDKNEEALRCRILASRGYIAATMNYTLRTEENADSYTVFSVLDEIDAALDAVKDFAALHGVTVEKAGVSGYSAGAHLALLYAYSRAHSAPVEIAFASSMAGPADISERSFGTDMTKRIATLLTGVTVTDEMLESGEADELLASVSPTMHVTPSSPPTAMIQGGRDNIVPPSNAQVLAETLDKNGVAHDFIYLKNSDHSLLQNFFKHLSYYKLLVRYADTYLS